MGTLMEIILERNNLNQAYKRVVNNKGAAGIDNMTVYELFNYLKDNKTELINSIFNGTYKPQPVRRVEIPKGNGGVRLLGIPTVIDRLIQQAITQVLTKIYDSTFSDTSYGFRPKRSAHNAITQARSYVNDGYEYVVDIDLSKYFDTINHDKLMYKISKTIKDKRVLKLIRLYLQSGVMINGVINDTTEGTPQGGPLSPLLANIYLDEFDKKMEERGNKFCRYADDIQIYAKSQRAAERILVNCKKYLETKMKLKVNVDKTAVRRYPQSKFLGFTFYKSKGIVFIVPTMEKRNKLKDKLRKITKRKSRKIYNIYY